MKKIMAILMAMMMVGMVNAGQTVIDINWAGSGLLTSDIDSSGNLDTHLWTSGNIIAGRLIVTDVQNNPYSYGVSNVYTYLTASVSGGTLDYVIERTKSYSPMYGSKGQIAYTYIGASPDAIVEVATGTSSNFATMGVGTYAQPKTSGGYNFEGSGDGFFINHGVVSSDGDGAGILLSGIFGTAGVNAMSSNIGATGFSFGKGQGCYTNANVNVVGSGTFDLTALADHSIVTDNGITTDGLLNIHAAFDYGFQFDNFALSGN